MNVLECDSTELKGAVGQQCTESMDYTETPQNLDVEGACAPFEDVEELKKSQAGPSKRKFTSFHWLLMVFQNVVFLIDVKQEGVELRTFET